MSPNSFEHTTRQAEQGVVSDIFAARNQRLVCDVRDVIRHSREIPPVKYTIEDLEDPELTQH